MDRRELLKLISVFNVDTQFLNQKSRIFNQDISSADDASSIELKKIINDLSKTISDISKELS